MFIVLGPSVEMHRGVHGSLRDHPPGGVEYVSVGHRHRFLLPGGAGPVPTAGTAFRTPTLAETVRYDRPPRILGAAGVHSSRLPVEGAVPFLVDTDDLVLTLLYGRPLVRGGVDLPDGERPEVRRRARWMLGAYLGETCHGVLFRTAAARTAALSLAGQLGADLGDRLAERSEVVVPSIRPGEPPLSTADRSGRPPHVVFVGDGWEDKGGPEAAAVMAALVSAGGRSLRLTWVGQWHAETTLPTVVRHDRLSRPEVLGLLADADILLAPSRFESFGMVLVEAMAHGVVPVTSSGSGMEHVAELLRPGVDSFTVDTAGSVEERAAELLRHVTALLDRPDRMAQMQAAAWRRVASGDLSLGRRDAALLPRYDAMARQGWENAEERDAIWLGAGERWVEADPAELSSEYRRNSSAGRRVRVAPSVTAYLGV